ncbi:MAG: hypothetical protein WBA93_31865 [Microcoleaceae cyanobacterium]
MIVSTHISKLRLLYSLVCSSQRVKPTAYWEKLTESEYISTPLRKTAKFDTVFEDRFIRANKGCLSTG